MTICTFSILDIALRVLLLDVKKVKRKVDVVDLFFYFCGTFFPHAVNRPYFLVDVISVDLFSEYGTNNSMQEIEVGINAVVQRNV